MTAVTAYLVDGQLIGGLYQRRQGHGFLQLKGAARYRGNQDFLDLERNARQVTAIPDDGIGHGRRRGHRHPRG